ncbi:E3 SUMO-protein ligase ZBED1-like [Diabrotica undecimpunctata]|uniref:E3 SUMO-protein ligase ZBED1-like n=1 Tax=Diabrotica undecimpunctata TaxID=50387 RepID=UPI003B636105
MIVKDLQPLSVIENPGFKELIAGLEPSYSIPSRFTFSNSFLPQKFQQKQDKLKALLSKTSAITITTDSWIAQHSQTSYISYTAHFIDNDWGLYSCLLTCHQYEQSHTAENLKDDLYNVLKEWNIFDKVFAVTTDNAANMKAAIKLTGWGHIGCFAHTVNLVVQSGIEITEIAPLKRKVKSIVEHFHRSTNANNKLIDLQKQINAGQPPLKLKNDVITRWNSTYFMFERFLKIKEPLNAAMGVLQIGVELLTELEWLELKEICLVLKPFEQISTEMSAEKNVNLSKIIVIVKGLESAMQKIKQKITTTNAAALINHFGKEIVLRFGSVESNGLMAKCTLLDPRFKTKLFCSEANLKMARERLENEVANLLVHSKELQNSPHLKMKWKPR